ncbi:winged helix-turn-helix transcriptional regulator [Streptomyces sp. NPDC006365]|uniref:winged helix-turn-helix transcriptional regulator n=1 Tax=Streptomyces sp. NPDC006365 TaxID=3364744 RepID=UPI0036765010
MSQKAGGSLRSLRRTNQEQILALLIDQGPLHRAALARLAGVSRTTVSTIVNELGTRPDPQGRGETDCRSRRAGR